MYLLYGRPHAREASWLTEISTWQPAFPPVRELRRLPAWLLSVHTGNLLAYPIGGNHGGSTVTFLLVVVGCLALWRLGQRDRLTLLLGALPLTFVAAALRKYPYGGSARVSLYMAPAFCLLAGVGLTTFLKLCLPRRVVPAGIGVAALVMAALASGGIVRDLLKPYKAPADFENRRAIRWLAEHTGPRDRWLVFNGLVDTPYAPALAGWGGSAARFRFYVAQSAPVSVRWSPDPAGIAASQAGRIWLIVYRDNNAPFPERGFEAYLQALSDRLGSPLRHHFPLGKVETVDVYEFPPRASPAPS
jgi:hypothetical protein